MGAHLSGSKGTKRKTETISSMTNFNKSSSGISGSMVFYFFKVILSHYGIPDSQHLCMLVSWIELFPPAGWDKDYCNQFVQFNPGDEADLTFTGSSWASSVLARGANPSSFTLSILKVAQLAVGIAPKKGFDHSGATMFSCGYYLYSSNQLYSDGRATPSKKFPQHPYVYTGGSIITCFYNREKGELSFTYNGIDKGVGYTNIPLTEDYYAAISVHENARIKLLDMTFDNK